MKTNYNFWHLFLLLILLTGCTENEKLQLKDATLNCPIPSSFDKRIKVQKKRLITDPADYLGNIVAINETTGDIFVTTDQVTQGCKDVQISYNNDIIFKSTVDKKFFSEANFPYLAGKINDNSYYDLEIVDQIYVSIKNNNIDVEKIKTILNESKKNPQKFKEYIIVGIVVSLITNTNTHKIDLGTEIPASVIKINGNYYNMQNESQKEQIACLELEELEAACPHYATHTTFNKYLMFAEAETSTKTLNDSTNPTKKQNLPKPLPPPPPPTPKLDQNNNNRAPNRWIETDSSLKTLYRTMGK